MKRKSNLVKLDEVFTSVSEDARAVYLDYLQTHYRVPKAEKATPAKRGRPRKVKTPEREYNEHDHDPMEV